MRSIHFWQGLSCVFYKHLSAQASRLVRILFHFSFIAVCLATSLTAQETTSFSKPAAMMAAPVTGTLKIDGQLDEKDWKSAAAIDSFVQVEPVQGGKTTFGTEVRILFDENNLYVGAICYDTAGSAGVRVPDLRRDFDYFENDLFGVSFDAFKDNRNSQIFQTNPYGALRDIEVIDGQVQNTDWDESWKVRTELTDSSWNVEMAIPWATLRYPDGGNDWGVNFVRNIRRLNEVSGWSEWPRSLNPYRMDFAGDLKGLKPPPPARNLRLQPYLAGRGNRINTIDGTDSDNEPDIGGEFKWAISPNTVLDLTVNTDFAEADADRQVINTSRFSVFFPEKRQFFLENGSLFDIGSTLAAKPFFSRRIGLDNSGSPIPIDGGGRVTYRDTRQSGGALLIRQRGNSDNPASNFAVGRYSRNIGDVNRIGGLVTHRFDESLDERKAVNNTVVSLDGLFRLTKTATAVPMISQSWTEGGEGDGTAAYVWLYNRANWGYIGHVQSYISESYNPAAGFLLRRNLIVTSPAVWGDWRPGWRPSFIRKFNPSFTGYWYHRATDRKFQEGSLTLRPVSMEFENGGWFGFHLIPNWQRLEQEDVRFFRPFGIELAPEDYDFLRYLVRFGSDQSNRISTSISASAGDYFNGSRNELSVRFKYSPSPHAALAVDYEVNDVNNLGLASEDETIHLWGSELRLALNPRLQMFAFHQYNSLTENSSWNLRFSWEFAPLSYLYFVVNDSRFINEQNDALPDTQQFILKLTHQFKI